MHKLLARQMAKATAGSGEIDLDRFYALVGEAYEQFDRDRRRTERATRLMIDEMEELHKAREAAVEGLAQQNRILDAALTHMAQGVAMLDAGLRLVVCNARFAEIYGMPPELIVPGTPYERIIDYHLAKHFAEGRRPAEYEQGGLAGALSHPYSVQEFSDGRLIAVTRRPMREGGWVTTHDDITERERLHEELRQQHKIVKEQQGQLLLRSLRFDAAINNMTEGLCFFDAGQRLISCNRRYSEMYGLAPDAVYPGITLREVLELRRQSGHFPRMSPEDFYVMRSDIADGDRPSDTEVELTNGRILEIHHRPLPDGGWVATHEDITERRRAEAKIAHMAHYDMLTDLPNRTLLTERLEEAMAWMNAGKIVALHLFDLDHFKHVNDTFGHPAGDKLLQLVASRLRGIVRDCDTVARTGGDEFAIIQCGLKNREEATALAERLVKSICAPFDIDGHDVTVGISIGIAIGPMDGGDGDELIRNADLALYRSKAERRSAYHFFEAEMDNQMKLRRALEADLRKAVTAGQFELHYQPVADLHSNMITGCEALLRWRHPQKGMIQPDAFIPLAEEIGAIIPLGEWVIREACRTAAGWPGGIKISINLSPVQFRSGDLWRIVVTALAASGLAADRLELEITENVLLTCTDAAVSTFNQLRELGVRIALDDFGAGYSSLSYLRRFPFDNIKIDRSFVKDITESTSSQCIVHAIAEMAQGLHMISTAEGVETPGQKAAVLAAGCSEMQGYLLSRALPADQLRQLFIRMGMMEADAKAAPEQDAGALGGLYGAPHRQRFV